MAKPVLVSGIQPTGKLHIGNYLGALKNFVELQNSGKYRCFFFVADMHALTENPNPADLRKNIPDLAASFLAVGLSPQKSTIFIQSQIPAHLQLYEILGPLTPVSELLRMTAFKEKVIQTLKLREGEIFTKEELKKAIDESNFGLAAYPVLMTADIILYDAKFVPVGHDQLQHLEIARTLARKFNNKYGKTFIEPKALLTKIPRVMSLDDPAKKMSKSRAVGCLFMDDSPAEIRKKISRAVTDSSKEVKYDEKNKPAVSNLLLIYSELSGKSVGAIEKIYRGKGYADFKKGLSETVIEALKPFQEKKKKLKVTDVKKALTVGNKKANAIASKKILEVKKRIGLLI